MAYVSIVFKFRRSRVEFLISNKIAYFMGLFEYTTAPILNIEPIQRKKKTGI